uniref:Receptor L-domain domain-containing protein n=1 Tax=Plectus sambesii TaxID=2011161 RepID=A0A914UXI2_9BILA
MGAERCRSFVSSVVIFLLSFTLLFSHIKCHSTKSEHGNRHIRQTANPSTTPSIPERREFCSGTDDGKTQSAPSTAARLQRLRVQYENCVKVRGNLEITFINQGTSNEENADPTATFRFLESIEEVTGYVLIYSNNIRRISLPKLRIVWGDTLYEDAEQSTNSTFSDPQNGAGFVVYNNPNLLYIDMPELRSIERGKIVAAHNNYLCYWRQLSKPPTIDFGQLVGKNNVTNRLLNFHASHLKNFKSCTRSTSLCHPNCTSGHCWGP